MHAIANTYCISGFSTNKDLYTWTEGEHAEMYFSMNGKYDDLTLTFESQRQMMELFFYNRCFRSSPRTRHAADISKRLYRSRNPILIHNNPFTAVCAFPAEQKQCKRIPFVLISDVHGKTVDSFPEAYCAAGDYYTMYAVIILKHDNVIKLLQQTA